MSHVKDTLRAVSLSVVNTKLIFLFINMWLELKNIIVLNIIIKVLEQLTYSCKNSVNSCSLTGEFNILHHHYYIF